MREAIARDPEGSFSGVPVSVSAVRLLAAPVLGGIIGIERERRAKPAGLKTHMLIAIAACLFILVSLEPGQMDFGDRGDVRIDPLRLIKAVTAGVAFLAAGTIFTARNQVRNITTGASMWLAGAIGVACGSGQMALAALATGIVVTVVTVVRMVERRVWPDDRSDE